jgi:formylglycine-generating enzyme required for sulfatase activity
MAGNVWQWVEDCYHPSYDGAPTDGSAWATRNCNNHVVRGGAYAREGPMLRAAFRSWASTQNTSIGFRVARELNP